MTPPRQEYAEAARWYAATVAAVPTDRWDRPGLGEWTVRELVAHGARALTTVVDYLAAPAPDGAAPEVGGPVAYFVRSATLDPAVAAAIAQRGREGAAGLGPDPAATVADLAERAVAVVAAHDDGELVPTPAGTMALGAYLPTRTLELVVHGADVATAAGLVAAPPPGPLATTAHLLTDLALDRGTGLALVRALTGRPAPDLRVL